jgi:hypothetical protein
MVIIAYNLYALYIYIYIYICVCVCVLHNIARLVRKKWDRSDELLACHFGYACHMFARRALKPAVWIVPEVDVT